MTISSVQSGYGVYKSDMPQTINQQPPNTASQGATGRDSVKISSHGKQLSQTNSQSNILPLEAYSIPSWMVDYTPEATMLSSEINYEYFSYSEQVNKMNISKDDQTQLIKNYLDNDPKHQEFITKDKFSRKYNNELSEYTSKLGTYFQDALKQNGVESRQDYYQKIMLNTEISEQVHQQVKEQLSGNDRMKELMELFGIA